MNSQLKQYAAEHRFLLEIVARQAGFESHVAVDMDEFYVPLVKAARRGPLLPIDGVLLRDWDPDNRRSAPGAQIGMRLYDIDGIRFARVRFAYHDNLNCWGLDFVAVDGKDYRRLYKIALRCRRDQEPPCTPPLLPQHQLELVASTDGRRLEDIEYLKNLLILHFMETGAWNWSWALKQFAINRHELNGRPRRQIGFGNHFDERHGYDLSV